MSIGLRLTYPEQAKTLSESDWKKLFNELFTPFWLKILNRKWLKDSLFGTEEEFKERALPIFQAYVAKPTVHQFNVIYIGPDTTTKSIEDINNWLFIDMFYADEGIQIRNLENLEGYGGEVEIFLPEGTKWDDIVISTGAQFYIKFTYDPNTKNWIFTRLSPTKNK